MQLTTLVEILRSEIPGLTERASTRDNLARLYAERGGRDGSDAERQGTDRGSAGGEATLRASVAVVTSLARAGKLEDAKREARRILSEGDVPPDVSTKLRRVLVRRSPCDSKRARGRAAK
ncbi:hypothetical protein [Paraliomyxa miuraensis]|uniref:hypothetical protein n=1 Tax=Paraliomyxa miuraensis TaxID=376150 RepID=UPI00225B669C|nr:hypothetical protein [Paraliomyxa miuraensis]MCX4246023.1 hypothetical protein [Paraliomyxa miuraensis]